MFKVLIKILFLSSVVNFLYCFQYNDHFYNHTMLWGTYRPQVYFGMKTRSTKPIITGIMWYNVEDGFDSNN